MPTTIQEIEGFANFAKQAAAGNDDGPSLEECLRLWREEQELAETVADIKASIGEIEAGNFTTLDEADRIIRAELGWPPRST